MSFKCHLKTNSYICYTYVKETMYKYNVLNKNAPNGNDKHTHAFTLYLSSVCLLLRAGGGVGRPPKSAGAHRDINIAFRAPAAGNRNLMFQPHMMMRSCLCSGNRCLFSCSRSKSKSEFERVGSHQRNQREFDNLSASLNLKCRMQVIAQNLLAYIFR